MAFALSGRCHAANPTQGVALGYVQFAPFGAKLILHQQMAKCPVSSIKTLFVFICVNLLTNKKFSTFSKFGYAELKVL